MNLNRLINIKDTNIYIRKYEMDILDSYKIDYLKCNSYSDLESLIKDKLSLNPGDNRLRGLLNDIFSLNSNLVGLVKEVKKYYLFDNTYTYIKGDIGLTFYQKFILDAYKVNYKDLDSFNSLKELLIDITNQDSPIELLDVANSINKYVEELEV